MAWPQIVVIVMFAIQLTVSGMLHNNLREINFFGRLVNVIVMATLLYFGGFWQ